MHTVLDAGYETTRTSISNAMELLVTHPDELRLLHENPGLVPNGVEEVLRFAAPAQHGMRYLVEPYDFDGGSIEGGQQVLLFLGAANRDEAVFPDPERFDVRRENAKEHLSFGGGRHHCLGAHLARMQLQETMAALVTRFPRMTLAGQPTRFPSLMFPSLSSLPVILEPSA
jgi:cytochrome P450